MLHPIMPVPIHPTLVFPGTIFLMVIFIFRSNTNQAGKGRGERAGLSVPCYPRIPNT